MGEPSCSNQIVRSTYICHVAGHSSNSFGGKECKKEIPDPENLVKVPSICTVKDCGESNPPPLFEVVTRNDGLHLRWLKKVSRILIIHKLDDACIMLAFERMISWIFQEGLADIYVEENTFKDLQKLSHHDNELFQRLKSFNKDADDLTNTVDLIICLGGDGTLLYASSLFQTYIPPIMAFNLGTLGFLTPFEFDSFPQSIPFVLNNEPKVICRSRLECTIVNNHHSVIKQCLNEVVIDRGRMPFLSNLDIYINNHYATTVAGDGLIISTPTGSTAYAMAVGASMIHPNVNCMLLAPISPHSLSFRPIVLPADNVEVRVNSRFQLPRDSGREQGASVSIDGRAQCVMQNHGDELRIRISSFPVPSLCQTSEVSDWFCGLAEILHWNARARTNNQQRH